jgi:hypothetical protein
MLYSTFVLKKLNQQNQTMKLKIYKIHLVEVRILEGACEIPPSLEEFKKLKVVHGHLFSSRDNVHKSSFVVHRNKGEEKVYVLNYNASGVLVKHEIISDWDSGVLFAIVKTFNLI